MKPSLPLAALLAWSLGGTLPSHLRAPEQIVWTATTPLPTARDHHVTFVVHAGDHSYLYVVGGHGTAGYLRDSWRSLILPTRALGPWEAAEPLPVAMAGMSLAIDSPFVLVVGGKTTGNRALADAFTASMLPDGSLSSWTRAPSLPQPRYHHTTVVANGFVWALGGIETTDALPTIFRARWSKDGQLSPWDTLPPLPGARSHQAAIVVDNYIYLVGGLMGNPAGANTQFSDVISAHVEPNGTLGPWKTVATMDSARATHSVVQRGRDLYVFGGVENNRWFSARVERARLLPNGALSAWAEVDAPLPAGRAHVHQTPTFREYVYSVGGSNAGQPIGDAFIGRFTER